jgi:protein subunit release factor B
VYSGRGPKIYDGSVMKNEKPKELLFSVTKKDFRIDTFRSGGKGGQKQNKTESGVRITHTDSSAVGESREERSQHQNKKIAFRRLIDSKRFKTWHRMRVAECLLNLQEINKAVDEMMDMKNIKVEYL